MPLNPHTFTPELPLFHPGPAKGKWLDVAEMWPGLASTAQGQLPDRGHGPSSARKWVKFLKRSSVNREGIIWISPGHSCLCWALETLSKFSCPHPALSHPLHSSPRAAAISLWPRAQPGLLSRVCRTRLVQGTNPEQGNLPSKPRNPWDSAPTRAQGVNPLGTRRDCGAAVAGAVCPHS